MRNIINKFRDHIEMCHGIVDLLENPKWYHFWLWFLVAPIADRPVVSILVTCIVCPVIGSYIGVGIARLFGII